ncbi:MAG: homocysteine S-methyltransferase family protein [Coriobacteriia bacterium]|jgi:5-methyltetrahydrofolate--homocysteine methyltransferase|nr:homocysteine S-methyltransferase family protein [Coriobacteriia bacterium]
MPDISTRLGRDVLVVDGAFGTMLQRANIPAEQCPVQLNVTAPELVVGIHADYVLAGADCVVTNTFGGSRPKLAEYGLGDQIAGLNRAAVRLACASGAQHVLGDVGPTGLVLEPLGTVSFDEAFGYFAEQIEALASEEPDAIIIETMTDIAEARCAVLAARAVCDLPVIASVTFGQAGVMDISGTDPATAAVILEAAGADVVGMNCGLGPEQMLPLVEAMAGATALPLIVQPNAGLPSLQDGRTLFPGTADEMGAYAARFVGVGASLVGSCCGSSPAFTGAIVDFAKELPVVQGRRGLSGVVIAGPRRTLRIGSESPIARIGERINPTGKAELAESLRSGSMSVVRRYAAEQADAGASALDVNVGAAGVDATDALRSAVLALSSATDLPLVLDNTDPAALEPALRVYPGRALINSVNGSAESLDAILPLACRYGAAVVALTLDDDGIPGDAAGRLAILERIRERAHAAGMHDSDLLVDTLVMTAATDSEAPRVTVDALRGVHERGLNTILGVSNVSHGLPMRPELNAAFIAVATASGLDAAIVNPGDHVVSAAVELADTGRSDLGREDTLAAAWEAWDATYAAAMERAATGEKAGKSEPAPSGDAAAVAPAHDERLAEAVVRGDVDGAPALVDSLIGSGVAAGRVIGEVLTPAIQRLGDAFARGETFLPQLMVAAEAMKAAVERVKTYLPEGVGSAEGRVVFATVKGDIHSIGKDICVSLLESQGFDVDDLGVDVASDRVLEAAFGADAVCLSALMTTTLPAMEATVSAVLAQDERVAVLVGGAVVTAEWASTIGAGYSDDAPGCVREVRAAVQARRQV